jgi:hypothetical protein
LVSENAFASIVSTLEGIEQVCNLLHPLKQLSGIVVMLLDKVTVSRLVHPSHRYLPMEATVLGMTSD